MRKIVQLFVVLLLCFKGIGQTFYSGRVFYDNNANQIFDSGDSSVPNCAISVQEEFGGGGRNYTTTGADGKFVGMLSSGRRYWLSLARSFINLRYYKNPPELEFVGGSSGNTITINFPVQKNPSPVQVKGRVYYDNNRNQIFDQGDLPATNAKMTLKKVSTLDFYDTRTDNAGNYLFYFDDGGYQIYLEEYDTEKYLPVDYKGTNDSNIANFPLQPNLPGIAHITGQVFYDNSGNHIFDGTDSGVSHSNVTAVNIKTLVRSKAQTDKAGDYFFNVDTGYYRIEFDGFYNNAQYLGAAPVSGYYPDGNNASYQADFYLQPQPDKPVRISGRAYYDNNGNRKFDAGDSVIVKGEVDVLKYVNSTYTGYDSVLTDADGFYYIREDKGFYNLSLWSATYNTQAYKVHPWIPKTYTSDTTDVVDFAVQKRDSIETTMARVLSASETPWDPVGPGVQPYNLIYGYEGALKNIPATVALDFSPLLTLSAASITPTKSLPGHVEWYIPTFKNGTDTIEFSLNLPVVGDTIISFVLHPSFLPGINVSKITTVTNTDYIQDIDVSANVKEIGATKGVKWIRSFPDVGIPYSQEDFAYSIDTVKNGRYYYMTCDRASQNGNGGTDYHELLIKLDKNGLNVWEREIAGFSEPVVTYLSDGGCAIVGTVYEYPDGDYNNRIKDVQVARFDSLGGLIWQKRLNGQKHEQHTGITQASDGSIIITGTTRSYDGDFVGNQADTTRQNVFLSKISATGNIVWTKVYGGSRDDESHSVVHLKNNTLLLMAVTQSVNGDVKGAHQHAFKEIIPAGSYYNDMYYTKADSLFASEAWVLNIDANGNILWSKCYGGTAESIITGAAENSGGYLLAGITNSRDGDLAYYKESFAAVWLTQISATGQIIWNKTYKTYGGYAGDGSDATKDYLERNTSAGGYTTRLHKTKDGNFVLGVTSSDQYGDVRATHGKSDIVLLKINYLGNIIWQKAIGGTKDEYLFDIQIDNNDDILFVGYTESQNDDLYEPLNNNTLMLMGKFGITNTISGHVFTDLNGNHIKDANEVYNNEGRIYSAKPSDTTIARIFGGQFLNNVDTGKYVTTYVPASEYFTVFPASKNSAFTSFDQSDSVDFALVPKPNIKDLQTVITPLTPARPGFESSYRIITKNVGTTDITNAVISLKKDLRQTYTSASRPNTGIAIDSVWWGPVTINAFTNDTLDVVLTNAVPPTLQNGDTLNIALYALPLAGDTTPANNKASLRQIVQGSFDPNDKTEAHAGIYTPTMKASNEPFQYLIRFQNTGTDTAFYVTVKDTLDAKVDVNSLETITASHAYKFSLEGRIATWQFNKILLVDSTTNEPASHGYIAFTIKPSGTLKLGDSVTNKAAIYFDFNLPVITDKSLLVLVSDKSVICPGGSTQFQAGQTGIAYQWQINTGGGFANLANGGIYSGATTSTLLISNAPSNLYGTQYGCVVTLQGGGKVNSQTYKLNFSNTWTGTVSTAWENAANWSCGSVPDENTDVIIKAGTPNTPAVNASTVVRSIAASAGAKVMVKSGVVLALKGK